MFLDMMFLIAFGYDVLVPLHIFMTFWYIFGFIFAYYNFEWICLCYVWMNDENMDENEW